MREPAYIKERLIAGVIIAVIAAIVYAIQQLFN